MPLALPDPQLPGDPQDALQSIQRNFEALAQTLAPPVPTGTVLPYAGVTAPNGYLTCDGSEVAVKDYPTLDALLGTTYGARTNGSGGAGSTHFRLPDLRGRVPVGKASSGTFVNVGATGGSETHTLTTSEIPSHAHDTINNDPGVVTNLTWSVLNNVVNTGATTDVPRSLTLTRQTAPNTGSTGGGGSHTNLQPYIVLNHIIKA